jgi:HAD superfamily hydrolase (TIGR01549 family)
MADPMKSVILYEGVLFDLGNTLIPFTPRDSMEFVVRWHRESGLAENEIPFRDFLEIFRSVVRIERKRSAEELWESSVEFRSREIAGKLNDRFNMDSAIEERLRSTHTKSFSACLKMRSSSRYVLDILKASRTPGGEKVKLALISNAMDGRAIRNFIESEHLDSYFYPVIISAEVGFTKPHPEIFKMALEEMDLNPEQTVYIGDRYETDVIGARNAGMDSIYTREYHTAGEPPDDIAIDSPTIRNILDLLPLLSTHSNTDNKG